MLCSEVEGGCITGGPVGWVTTAGATALMSASAFLVAVAEVPSRMQISLADFVLVPSLLGCPAFGATAELKVLPKTKGTRGPAGEV